MSQCRFVSPGDLRNIMGKESGLGGCVKIDAGTGSDYHIRQKVRLLCAHVVELSSPDVGFRALGSIQLLCPPIPGPNNAVVAIVLGGICVTGFIPIIVRQELVAQYPHIAGRERQSHPVSRIDMPNGVKRSVIVSLK